MATRPPKPAMTKGSLYVASDVENRESCSSRWHDRPRARRRECRGSTRPIMDLGWYPRWWHCCDDRLPSLESEEVGLSKSDSLRLLRWRHVRSGFPSTQRQWEAMRRTGRGFSSERSRNIQLFRPSTPNIIEAGARRFATRLRSSSLIIKRLADAAMPDATGARRQGIKLASVRNDSELGRELHIQSSSGDHLRILLSAYYTHSENRGFGNRQSG